MSTEFKLFTEKDGSEVPYEDCPSVRYTGEAPELYVKRLAALPGVTRVETVDDTEPSERSPTPPPPY